MKKYKVEVQKIVDGYVEFYADPDDPIMEIVDFARDRDDLESIFVEEYVTWEVGRFDLPVEIDATPNAELWK